MFPVHQSGFVTDFSVRIVTYVPGLNLRFFWTGFRAWRATRTHRDVDCHLPRTDSSTRCFRDENASNFVFRCNHTLLRR